ncbi:hypothetical protein [Amycolatopsis sp. cmx-4-68]|uniref:hypothetical protein n=1 Tax=Amycolatopsis sp. cmx-4-68 TaxID=2790938 RepID=UPI00397CF2A7
MSDGVPTRLKCPNVAFGASSAPNVAFGALDATNATLGRFTGHAKTGAASTDRITASAFNTRPVPW